MRRIRIEVEMSEEDLADLVRFMLHKGHRTHNDAILSMITGSKAYMTKVGAAVDEAKVKQVIEMGWQRLPGPPKTSISDDEPEIKY